MTVPEIVRSIRRAGLKTYTRQCFYKTDRPKLKLHPVGDYDQRPQQYPEDSDLRIIHARGLTVKLTVSQKVRRSGNGIRRAA